MKRWLLVLLACTLLAACGPAKSSQHTLQDQLKGNQALLLVLQNAPDLDNLYFYYTGTQNDAVARTTAGTQTQAQQAQGTQLIGELNLMMVNVGGSVTAGGLYVSGYDPNLILIRSRLGQLPISSSPPRNCYQHINVVGTGQYDVALFCDLLNSNSGIGGSIQGNANGGVDSATVSLRNLGYWADQAASAVTSNNVDFFTRLGVFTNSRVDCNIMDGLSGCRISFGNPAFNPNRASHGYILTNFAYPLIANCTNNCRRFPENFPSGVVMRGISDAFPTGESLYYDYDIFLNKSAWSPELNDMRTTFQVTACYLYTTVITPTVCVDPDPTSRTNEPCTPGPIIYKDGQGAPVKVTRIDEESRPGTTAFTIHLQEVGDGQVWLPGAFDQCSPYSPVRPDKRMMDAVVLLDARVSGDMQQMRCTGQSWDPTNVDNPAYRRMVRLENGQGQITCLYDMSQPGLANMRAAYSTAMTLEFGYVYSNSVRKDVVIHRT